MPEPTPANPAAGPGSGPGNYEQGVLDSLLNPDTASTPASPPAPPAPPPAPAPAPGQKPAPAANPASTLPGVDMSAIMGKVAPPANTANTANTANPDDDDEISDTPPAPNDPKADHEWKKVRGKYKTARARVQELEQEFQAFKKSGITEAMSASQKRIQELETQNAQYDERIAQISLSESKQFKDKFVAPVQAAESRVLEALVKSGMTEEEAKARAGKLIGMDYKTLEEELAYEKPIVAGSITLALTERAKLVETANKALTDWRSTRAGMEVEGSLQSTQQKAELVSASFDAGLKKAIANGNWMYADMDDESFRAARSQNLEAAKGILMNGSGEDIAALVLEGLTARSTRLMLEQAHADRLKAEEALSRITGAAPAINGTPDRGTPGAAPLGGTSTTPRSASDYANQVVTNLFNP
jgi:Uncharacterized protein containing TOPRIM domain, potential nuclease